MDSVQAAVLGLIQGLTEFLPISSSGHLVLVPLFLGWEDQSLAFDVAVHVGTLAAVAVYFQREVVAMGAGFFRHVRGGPLDADAKLAWGLVVATIPAGVVGIVMRLVLDVELNSPLLIAANLAVFGILLFVVDRWLRGERSENDVSWGGFLLLGCAQALALSPGTSRSGITMTAAMAMGLSRVAAARISFLMALPVIFLAGALELYKLLASGAPAPWTEIAVGMSVAFVSGILCIHFLLQLLQRMGFLPFVIYRLILAGVIVIAYSGA